MPAPAKTVEIGGLLLKAEGVGNYGNGGSVAAASDGVLMYLGDRFALGAPAKLSYKGSGEAGLNPGNIGPKKRQAKSGRSITLPIPHQFKGAGAAYSASVFTSFHRLMLGAGFTAAVTTTPGSEKWVFTPHVPGTFDSVFGEAYARREKWPFTGGLLDWEFTGDGPVAPMHTFNLQGISSALPTDAATPSITYPALTVEPPIASAIAFTLGSYVTAEVLRFGFKLGRNLQTERVNLTASAAHQGFYPAGFDPELRVTIEQSAFVGSPFHTSSGVDPYNLEASANAFVGALAIGATQYNRWKLDFPQMQLVDAIPGNNNAIATVELVLKPFCTTPVSNDFMTVTAD